MTAPRPSSIRHKVEPADVPPAKAARRLHLTLEQFEAKLPELQARGFPSADPTTGMYDLEEIDRWRASRHHRPQPNLTATSSHAEPSPSSMGDRYREAKERKRHGRAA
jgi:hypothetical protein